MGFFCLLSKLYWHLLDDKRIPPFVHYTLSLLRSEIQIGHMYPQFLIFKNQEIILY